MNLPLSFHPNLPNAPDRLPVRESGVQFLSEARSRRPPDQLGSAILPLPASSPAASSPAASSPAAASPAAASPARPGLWVPIWGPQLVRRPRRRPGPTSRSRRRTHLESLFYYWKERELARRELPARETFLRRRQIAGIFPGAAPDEVEEILSAVLFWDYWNVRDVPHPVASARAYRAFHPPDTEARSFAKFVQMHEEGWLVAALEASAVE